MDRGWLVQARMKKGMSQAEVAKQSGIVQQSYQLIERGVNNPRPETAKRIGAVLGVPWFRFYEDTATSDAEEKGGENRWR